jgi:hypothetical protein
MALETIICLQCHLLRIGPSLMMLLKLNICMLGQPPQINQNYFFFLYAPVFELTTSVSEDGHTSNLFTLPPSYNILLGED